MPAVQRLAPVLVLLLLSACHEEATKPASQAQIVESASDAGVRDELVFSGKKLLLPDVDKDTTKRDTATDATRAAYRTRTGAYRVVYVVGDALLLGGTQPTSDLTKAPDFDHALNAIFEADPERRVELVGTIRKIQGEDGVVKLLVATVGTPDLLWDATVNKLLPAQLPALRDGLAVALEPGQPMIALVRAAKLVDLSDPKFAKVVNDHVRDTKLAKEQPLVAASFLRAFVKSNAAEGAKVACEVIARPLPKVNEDAALVDAAFFAVGDGAACPGVDAAAEAYLKETMCQPSLRCDANGPLGYSTTTKQDEPVCTAAQIKAAKDEQGRGPLFAYGLLLAHGKVPDAFGKGHERRRYAIDQKAEPHCDNIDQRAGDITTLPQGTACHCEDVQLRFHACRVVDEGPTQFGICRFVVNDKAKKILSVTAAPHGTNQ